jgi:hypothetical protein
VSRTFNTAGSYAMTVSKSGYTSANCSVVTVTNVGAPSCGTANVSSFTANPDRVRADNNTGSTLTYNAAGVDTSCVISGPNVSTTVPANACAVSGSLRTPQITQQSTYRISCDGGEATASVIVNIIPKFLEF